MLVLKIHMGGNKCTLVESAKLENVEQLLYLKCSKYLKNTK